VADTAVADTAVADTITERSYKHCLPGLAWAPADCF
jgi:hypothetical protein